MHSKEEKRGVVVRAATAGHVANQATNPKIAGMEVLKGRRLEKQKKAKAKAKMANKLWARATERIKQVKQAAKEEARKEPVLSAAQKGRPEERGRGSRATATGMVSQVIGRTNAPSVGRATGRAEERAEAAAVADGPLDPGRERCFFASSDSSRSA